MSHFASTFLSDRPDLSSADTEFDRPGVSLADKKIARQYEEVINSAAFLDPHHRGHLKAVAEARSLAETLYGDAPVRTFTGASQAISSVDGAVIDPAVQMQQAMHPRHAEYLAGRVALNNDDEVT